MANEGREALQRFQEDAPDIIMADLFMPGMGGLELMDVLRSPRHPYTSGLLAAVPRLDAPRDRKLTGIPGTVPSPDAWPAGCAFEPRCAQRMAACSRPPPVGAADQRQVRCWLER